MAHLTPAEAERAESIALATSDASYVDWPAIFAGTALALTLSFVLLTFGSAIGLSMTSFEPGEGVSLRWMAIASGIWFLWVAITASGAGGYMAGRLRRPVGGASTDETEVRDGAHGVVVWAAGTLIGALMAVHGVTGMVGAAGGAAGTAAQAAAEAVGGDVDYLGSRLVGGSEEGAGAAAGVLMRNLGEEEMSAEDRAYLVDIVARNTELPPEEAEARVDQALAEARELYATALETAEQGRRAAAIGAFLVAATLMASAAAAYFAAAAGGDHRDRAVPFSTFGRR